METEIWAPIKGYKIQYYISNMGRIKGNRGRILSGYYDKDGYVCIDLYGYNCKDKCKVHRLVALTFIENTYNKPQVNHKNGIKDDNRAENLEWVTGKENIYHGQYVIGTIRIKKQKQHKDASEISDASRRYNIKYGTLWKRLSRGMSITDAISFKRTKSILYIDGTGKEIIYESIVSASTSTGVDQHIIISICKGRRKQFNNFKFYYYA